MTCSPSAIPSRSGDGLRVHKVAPPGIEPTGLPHAMQTAHFYRSRDGRLCEHWGVRDELSVLLQVGALHR